MIYHSEKAIQYGKQLRIKRKEAGLTQVELARILGIAAQYVSKFETGARYPWKSARAKINEYFETSLDYVTNTTIDAGQVNKVRRNVYGCF